MNEDDIKDFDVTLESLENQLENDEFTSEQCQAMVKFCNSRRPLDQDTLVCEKDAWWEAFKSIVDQKDM